MWAIILDFGMAGGQVTITFQVEWGIYVGSLGKQALQMVSGVPKRVTTELVIYVSSLAKQTLQIIYGLRRPEQYKAR